MRKISIIAIILLVVSMILFTVGIVVGRDEAKHILDDDCHDCKKKNILPMTLLILSFIILFGLH